MNRLMGDAPRRGAPRSVGDEEVERLIILALDTQPQGATHWSTRMMARHLGMGQTMVSRTWRAFGLAPHRSDTFKLSTDPAFVDKVRDVVGLYMNPPDRALVLCVDEKPQTQAVGERLQWCPCDWASWSGAPMTTNVTEQPIS